jgi:hypothetical protein
MVMEPLVPPAAWRLGFDESTPPDGRVAWHIFCPRPLLKGLVKFNRLVFVLCGTYLTKNLAFWYKSYCFVDSIKFLLSI